MLRLLFCFAVCVIKFCSGLSLCGNGTLQTRNCSHIFDQHGAGYDTCTVQQYQPNSEACKVMNFGDLNPNTQIGGVSLRPYILKPIDKHGTNYTVLNITFSNIKWKTMKFRFQLKKTKDAENSENHCSNIVLSNDKAISDQFVLYYDCYWSQTERYYNGRSHILDFVATDDVVENRGQYYFNMPSLEMLSPSVKEYEWKPFVYMELLTRTLKLHILPPPKGLKILGYRILVKRECDRIEPTTLCIPVVKNETVSKNGNMTDEVLFEYNYVESSGVYYFAVSPLYHDCVLYGGCQIVETPRIRISNELHAPLNICIASVSALVVASLFAYYIVLKAVRRYWCKDGDIYEIPSPPKILVIYPSANRLHAECVASFITYLRSEYGFDIMYDGDITATSHGDPQIWAEEAFKLASHILYIVGPVQETNLYNNIYDKPLPNICALKNIDRLLLVMIKTAKALTCHKDIANVFFEHSNKAYVPMETTHEKKYFLLKDWQKLIADLSKNLLPKRQIMRTERGKSFLEDLTRAKKLLGNRNDDVFVKCEMNAFEKKVLL